jgi:hypothetical protein
VFLFLQAGTFAQAEKNVLEKREIKKAKRKGVTGQVNKYFDSYCFILK